MATNAQAVREALTAAMLSRPTGAWIRATGYHEGVAGALTRDGLDKISISHKLRIQHRSGALWMLNTPALDAVLAGDPAPDAAIRDANGVLTGHFRRADAWLRTRVPPLDLSLGQACQTLARRGVTGFTDASVTNDAGAAEAIATRVRDGSILQRVMLMGAPNLPPASQYMIGPVKFLLDDSTLPDVDVLADQMRRAHAGGRAIAIHCVTIAELAVALAALDAAGAAPGDRIEHGGEITEFAAREICRLGLTVVTQPAFIHDKGDRYLRDCEDPNLLYACNSLMRLGVRVAGSSDAPYGDADPWLAMRTATTRRTRAGAILNAEERVTPGEALSLYLGGFGDPGGQRRRVEIGARADLCLLAAPISEALDALDASLVVMTMVNGAVVYLAERR